MASLTVYSGAADGHITSSDDDPNYANARAGTPSFSFTASTGGATATTGQRFPSGLQYDVMQSFHNFDVSAIPAGATIDAVELAIWPTSDQSATDFTIQARTKDWGAALTTADWTAGASLSGLTLLATLSTAGLSTGAYQAFTENGTALRDAVAAALAGDGVVRVMLSSDRTAAGTTPTGNEFVIYSSADEAGTTQDPKLTITYTPAASGNAARAMFYARTRRAG